VVAIGMVALLAGMWGGLARIGWGWPEPPRALAPAHGPLMVSGFLGTLIGLERAVALGRPWTYGVPLLSGTGGLMLIAGLPEATGRLAMTGSALGLVVIFALRLRRLPGVPSLTDPTWLCTVTMGLGALAWLVGNTLWLIGWPVSSVVSWWAGFLVLTIAGERLELSRFLPRSREGDWLFVAGVALLLAGLALGGASAEPGARLVGIALLIVTLWLLRHDAARLGIRRGGLPRFVGASLLSAYPWLGVAGTLAATAATAAAGPRYDAWLHAVFLGFAFAMIFGHAPIIFPAVLGISIPFRPAFYAHLLLLHLSLLLRVSGDLLLWWPARQWGGLLNASAVLLFLGNTAASVIAGSVGTPPQASNSAHHSWTPHDR
jgi:hypothetical protein